MERIPAVAPAVLLSLIVGAFHTSMYVLIRGSFRAHVLLALPAAIVGAWLGQAIALRMGDPVRLGDFGLLWASALSWVGIGIVASAATLGQRREQGGAEKE